MKKHTTVVLAAIAALAAPLAHAESPAKPPLFDRDWSLLAVDREKVTYRATLRLSEPDGPAGGKLSGAAPCNRYVAGYRRTEAKLELAPIASTRRACLAMAEESAYFGLLQGVTGLSYRDGLLSLSGAGHVLEFGPAPDSEGGGNSGGDSQGTGAP